MHNYQQEKKEEIIKFRSKQYDENDEVIGEWEYEANKKTNIILSIRRLR